MVSGALTCGFTRTFRELELLAMIAFGWSSSRGLRAIFLSSRTVDRVEGHPVPSWLDLSRCLRSFESYGWAERWTVLRISGYGAVSRSR